MLRMKPMRQFEAAELMTTARVISHFVAGASDTRSEALMSERSNQLRGWRNPESQRRSAQLFRPQRALSKRWAVCFDAAMAQPSTRSPLYRGYRFPPEIISWCVWLYYRFSVSLRDVSELMLARGIEVSHEAIRPWTLRFGAEYARRLRRSRGACSNIRHLDELCLMIKWGARLAVAGRR